jgi:hypothetical protein
MRNLIVLTMLLYPLSAFSSNEAGPEDYKITWLLLAIIVLLLVLSWLRKRGGKDKIVLRLPFTGRRLKVDLLPDRRYRPRTLTLVVKNTSRKDIDIEAPVIMFRKLLLIRKFKLKGIDRNMIYPLYLEAGKEHELRISLNSFHEYDPALRKYYWARILLNDISGRKYQTRYVTLRKSLFS